MKKYETHIKTEKMLKSIVWFFPFIVLIYASIAHVNGLVNYIIIGEFISLFTVPYYEDPDITNPYSFFFKYLYAIIGDIAPIIIESISDFIIFTHPSLLPLTATLVITKPIAELISHHILHQKANEIDVGKIIVYIEMKNPELVEEATIKAMSGFDVPEEFIKCIENESKKCIQNLK